MLSFLVVIRKANRQEFQQIQAHFIQKWAHQKGTCGQLHDVLVIDNPRLQQQFQTYLSSLSVQTISQHYHVPVSSVLFIKALLSVLTENVESVG